MKSTFCPSCPKCQKPTCIPGYYGVPCNQTCDRNCREIACLQCACNVCDRISGRCVNGCDAGWYGATCNQICPENCFQEGLIDVHCAQMNGTCIFGCGKGYYGNRCNETCSDKCLNRVCEQTTGHCSQGCIRGFGGSFCNEETGGIAADQIAGAVGGAFVVILWGVIVIILICFIYRRRQKDYGYFRRNDVMSSPHHRSSSRRRLHRQESVSSQGHVMAFDPECNDCNEIAQEIQAIEDFHSTHSRHSSFSRRHLHRSSDYIIDSPMFDCPLVYSCHPVLVQECPEHAPPDREVNRRQRDDLASSRTLIQGSSIEEEQDEEEEILIPRKFSNNFVPPQSLQTLQTPQLQSPRILKKTPSIKSDTIEVLPSKNTETLIG